MVILRVQIFAKLLVNLVQLFSENNFINTISKTMATYMEQFM